MKDKIKVGDTVEHKNNQGLCGVVSQVSDRGEWFLLKGGKSWKVSSNFRVVVDTSKYHKHHDSIVAWAKGAEIEYGHNDEWFPTKRPAWHESSVYRIKPTEPTELELLEQKYKELGDAIQELKENK